MSALCASGNVHVTEMTPPSEPAVPKTRGRLTPLERLVNTCLGGLMGQRVMVARHGKKHHRLKVEDTVVLTHVRLAHTQGKVITATSLAEDMMIDRKAAERGLKRLVERGLIISKEKAGKEVVYESSPGYTYPSYLIDDIVGLAADQISLGHQLDGLAAELDDQELKDRIAKAVAVKMTAFRLT